MCVVGVSVRGFEGQEGGVMRCAGASVCICVSKHKTKRDLSKTCTQLFTSCVSSINKGRALVVCIGREGSTSDGKGGEVGSGPFVKLVMMVFGY